MLLAIEISKRLVLEMPSQKCRSSSSGLDLTLERHRNLLRQGAIVVDENDPGEAVRVLVYLEHSIQDARTERDGPQRVVSRRMQYVEIFDPHPPPRASARKIRL
jgi:hypothetical protein